MFLPKLFFSCNFMCVASYLRQVPKRLRSGTYKVFMSVKTSPDSHSVDLSKPEEPNEDDCCHSGCQSCVFDVYLQALERWKLSEDDGHSNIRFDLLSQTKFKPFILTAMKKLSDDTNLYTFKPKVDDNLLLSGRLPYNAGQYLSLRIDTSQYLSNTEKSTSNENVSGSSHLVRDFTITSLSNEMRDCCFEMVIKLYEGSVTSNYLKAIRTGDVTHWRGPYGDFIHEPNKYSHLIMFCMGTGVAPMFPIAKEIVENGKDETIVSLHFGCRKSSEIILRDEIKLLSDFWNFNCCFYLSEEKDISLKNYKEQFVLSHITNKHIEKAIFNKSNYYILICGSADFNNDLLKVLEKLNVDKNKYYLF